MPNQDQNPNNSSPNDASQASSENQLPTARPDESVADDAAPVGTVSSAEAENIEDIAGIEENRLYAALAYLFLLVLIPLLTRKNDPFVNFHARQGLLLTIGIIIAAIAAVWSSIIGSLLFLAIIIVDLIGLIQALQGNRWKIPGIGDLAEKIKV